MTWLGAALAATAAATLTAGSFGENTYWLLSALLLAAAVAAVRSGPVSTFHSLLMGVFGFEAVGLTFYILAGDAGLRPEIANALKTSQPVAMTLAMSVIGLRALALIPIVRRATAISDRFFASKERLALRVLGRTVMIPNSVIARVGTISMVFLSQTIVLLQIQTLLVTSEFMNAMQALDGPRFWHMLLVVTPLWVIATLAVHMVNDMLAGLMNIRWRRSLSEGYVRRWIGTGAHYRMALAGLGTDNPDQRIQSDVDAFVDGGEGTAFGVVFLTFDVIRQFSAFLAYSIILWGLSAKIKPFGPDLVIPGLLFWAAVLYAAATTAGTILIGRRLIRLSYERQHFEADYRFGLARLREYGEPITLMSGNRTEVGIVDALFARVRANSRATIWVRARLTLFNMVVGTIGQKAPYLALGGLYIARQVQLGDLTQAAAAFGQVVATLNFVSARFSSLAALKSVIDRLTSFDAALDRTESEGGGTYRRCDGGTDLALTDATIRLPDGEIIARDVSVRFEAGQNVLITGPSGTGKSTLFRVLAGIWPYWEGTAILPAGATLLVLPQASYLPVGTLRTAVCYPAPADAFTSEAVAAALTDAGLGHLTDALDRDENWAQTLSGGERQRLAIARALLIAPDWLLLDEATSAMDMTLERHVYETLRQRLPKTTLISIGHRDSLVVHHARRIHVTREGHGLRFAPSTKAA